MTWSVGNGCTENFDAKFVISSTRGCHYEWWWMTQVVAKLALWWLKLSSSIDSQMYHPVTWVTLLSGLCLLMSQQQMGTDSISHKTFIVRSCKISKVGYQVLDLFNCSDIWQVIQQQCCLGTCQISKQYKHFNTQSCLLETLWDLTTGCLMWYWIIPQLPELLLAQR